MATSDISLHELRFPNIVALVSRTWRKTIDSRLQQFDLTEATWLPLLYLSRLDKPVRQKELAAMLSLDSSSVVRVLNNLENLELIQRTPEPDDRRAKATVITEKGLIVIQQVESISKQLEQEIRMALNPDDFKVARSVLENLYEILIQIDIAKSED